jgi:hypothetical protein
MLNILNYNIHNNIIKEIIKYLPEDLQEDDIKKISDMIINIDDTNNHIKYQLLFNKYKDKFEIDDLKIIITKLLSYIQLIYFDNY